MYANETRTTTMLLLALLLQLHPQLEQCYDFHLVQLQPVMSHDIYRKKRAINLNKWFTKCKPFDAWLKFMCSLLECCHSPTRRSNPALTCNKIDGDVTSMLVALDKIYP
ncbi:hypothetical protein QL285_001708 [Trifolium repens]|nr:hypothetical protein QL285_001708 [Trifolium repens]